MDSPTTPVRGRPTDHLPLNVTPSTGSPWLALIFLAFPAAFHVLAVEAPDPRHEAFWPLFFNDLIFGGFSAAFGYYLYRMRGLGASVSVDGLFPSVNGEAQWTIPWSRIGELRRAIPRFPGSLDPRTRGIDVIDTEGVFQFRIPFPVIPEGPRSSDGRFANQPMFWREVRLRLPDGAKIDPHERRNPPVPTLAHAALYFVTGFGGIGGGLGSMVLSIQSSAAGVDATPLQVLARSPIVAVGGMLILCAGLGVVIVGGSTLGQTWSPESRGPDVIPDPVEGPRIDDHVAFHGGKNVPIIALQEGVRYRTIDPEFHRRSHESRLAMIHAIWWAYPLILAMGSVALVLDSVAGLHPDRVYGAFTMLFGFAICGHVTAWISGRRRMTCDDTVVRHGDDIFIVGPDGKRLSFPVSQLAEEKRARSRLRDSDYTDLLRNGRDRYRLNRARLFASEIPLDHEEIRP